MADTKISELPATTTAADAAVVPIVVDIGGTLTTAKITVDNLRKAIIASGLQIKDDDGNVFLDAGEHTIYGATAFTGDLTIPDTAIIRLDTGGSNYVGAYGANINGTVYVGGALIGETWSVGANGSASFVDGYVGIQSDGYLYGPTFDLEADGHCNFAGGKIQFSPDGSASFADSYLAVDASGSIIGNAGDTTFSLNAPDGSARFIGGDVQFRNVSGAYQVSANGEHYYHEFHGSVLFGDSPIFDDGIRVHSVAYFSDGVHFNGAEITDSGDATFGDGDIHMESNNGITIGGGNITLVANDGSASFVNGLVSFDIDGIGHFENAYANSFTSNYGAGVTLSPTGLDFGAQTSSRVDVTVIPASAYAYSLVCGDADGKLYWSDGTSWHALY